MSLRYNYSLPIAYQMTTTHPPTASPSQISLRCYKMSRQFCRSDPTPKKLLVLFALIFISDFFLLRNTLYEQKLYIIDVRSKKAGKYGYRFAVNLWFKTRIVNPAREDPRRYEGFRSAWVPVPTEQRVVVPAEIGTGHIFPTVYRIKSTLILAEFGAVRRVLVCAVHCSVPQERCALDLILLFIPVETVLLVFTVLGAVRC